jgi:hypothetical protein
MKTSDLKQWQLKFILAIISNQQRDNYDKWTFLHFYTKHNCLISDFASVRPVFSFFFSFIVLSEWRWLILLAQKVLRVGKIVEKNGVNDLFGYCRLVPFNE